MNLTPKILIIDDEKDFTAMLSTSLIRTGRYRVKVENDSTKAIETAQSFMPDLILLDIVMPGIDGGDLSSRLRGHPTLGKVPVILVSALISSDETGAGDGISVAGHTPIISKPVKMDILTHCIDQTIAKAS